MQFYTLDFTVDDLGYTPQDNGIIGQYNVNAPNSLRQFKYNDQIKELWVPDGMKFRYQSKFTDILCFTVISFPFLILSEKFLQVLSTLQLPRHEVFRLNVVKRDKTVPYNLFISKQCFAEYFDYDQTVFFFDNYYTRVKEFIKIKDAHEFWAAYNLRDETKHLRASNVALNVSEIKHDMFRLPRSYGMPHYIVSEKFMVAVTQAALTGIAFKPFDGKQ